LWPISRYSITSEKEVEINRDLSFLEVFWHQEYGIKYYHKMDPNECKLFYSEMQMKNVNIRER
jgi:hypothetical protein